jgi:uncharacterized protein involved in exopolysaccharide biosynthesis
MTDEEVSDRCRSVPHGAGALFRSLLAQLKLLLLAPLSAGLVALAASYLITPTFTARTVFLPPQQQPTGGTGALASLGALSSLAGSGLNFKNPIDQYVSLLQSTAVADKLIDRFDLTRLYESRYRFEAREDLSRNTRIAAGRKDGLITLEVDDHDPKRAAEMANRYVDELRGLVADLALTEAQQRRKLFEGELARTRDRLAHAQTALQASGYSAGAMKAEPKAAAEAYARTMAEFTTAQVLLHSLQRHLTDSAPEVQQQRARLATLRATLAERESSASAALGAGPNYIGRFRDFKYQETLFDLFARQYELARVDEGREGALIQVIDVATPPERKSRPQRALIAAATGVIVFVLLMAYLLATRVWAPVPTATDRARGLAEPA